MLKCTVSRPQGRGGEGMRGKLRDKRTDLKRDRFKRELIERRRTNKRENRISMVWLNQQLEQEEEYQLLEEEELLENKQK